MNWTNVKVIFLREVRDQLRDRRTLFMIAVLPVVLYPLLGMSMFQVTQFVREQTTKVLVVGAWRLPEEPPLFEDGHVAERWFVAQAGQKPTNFDAQGARGGAARPNSHVLEVDFLKRENLSADKEQQSAEWQQLIDQGRYDAVLYFPEGFAERLDELKHILQEPRPPDFESVASIIVPRPELFYSTAGERSQVTAARLFRIIERYSDEVGRENLAAGRVPDNASQPFVMEEKDVADKGHRDAALWSKILPFLLLVWALTGAFYPAVDVCAGEKERGTLETLLSSPAERIEIVWGKLLTVMVFSMATAVLNLISMGITGTALLSQLPRFGSPPPWAPLWLLIALVPVAALFSALCMALASFARSTKEGQYYLMPLVLVTLPLVMLPMSPGVELTLGNSLIPVTGVVLLLRAMLEGNYTHALLYGPPVILATMACCLLAIRWAVDQFNSESVLFRESERFDLKLWMRQLLRDREDTPTVAGAVFCGVLILLINFFMSLALPQPGTFEELARVVLVSALVVVATPALLMTVMLTRSPVQTLLLRWPGTALRPGSFLPGLFAIPASILLAVTIFPAASWLVVIVQQLYPLSEPMQQALTDLLREKPALWKLLLLMGILPAVCEELAFRGFILSGLRHLGRKWRAIIVSSLFFGVTHMVFQQSILAFLSGMVIGYLAVQTGSLLPCILYHATHNSLLLTSTFISAETIEKYPVLGYLLRKVADSEHYMCNGPTVAVAGLAALALLAWFRGLPHPKTPEEALQEAISQHASHAPAAGS